MAKIKHLSVEEALMSYTEVMLQTGSKPMFRDIASLEFSLERTKEVYNKEKEVLLLKAAFLLREIASKHPFMDGNKRGASAITDRFLRLNGKKLKLEMEDVEFLKKIGAKKIKIQGVKKWLEKRVH